jgi:hypothetical protein
MVEFDLWGPSFIFSLIFSFVILIPCIVIAFMGRRMITRLGTFPSQAPSILMSICLQFILVAIVSLGLLVSFFQFFAE